MTGSEEADYRGVDQQRIIRNEMYQCEFGETVEATVSNSAWYYGLIGFGVGATMGWIGAEYIIPLINEGYLPKAGIKPLDSKDVSAISHVMKYFIASIMGTWPFFQFGFEYGKTKGNGIVQERIQSMGLEKIVRGECS